MSDYLTTEVVDLTNSFTLANHCAISNVIINLDTDESFSIDSSVNIQSDPEPECLSLRIRVTKEKSLERKKSSKRKDQTRRNTEKKERRQSSKFGECPICWDELGNNPLASTKCGHVFCIKCLKQSLHFEKRCPTCRITLKGSSAYHPLYFYKG